MNPFEQHCDRFGRFLHYTTMNTRLNNVFTSPSPDVYQTRRQRAPNASLLVCGFATLLALVGCAGDNSEASTNTPNGGAGGSSANAGTAGSGNASGSSNGGTAGTSNNAGSGGSAGTGNSAGSGGVAGSGATAGTGGSAGSGATAGAGGSAANGGSAGTGANAGAGGIGGSSGGGTGGVAPTCNDGISNGTESDIDCGGTCAPCIPNQSCVFAGDCDSGVCDNAICQAPTCTDGVQNGDEKQVDCGGPECGPCGDGAPCELASECINQVCKAGVCLAAQCDDGVKNGSEGDIDCGQICSTLCNIDQSCLTGPDCVTGSCVAGICAAPTCTDGVQNGNETGLDCGGPDCNRCPVGQGCDSLLDCQTYRCIEGICADTGCADGQREGFLGFSRIAACAGAWDVPGVKSPASYVASCNNTAGDEGTNPLGVGCSVADLCEPGWHVCTTPAEVASAAAVPNPCTTPGILPDNSFFATRQSGEGSATCAPTGNDDLFGCGTISYAPLGTSCAPLNKFSDNSCDGLGSAWSCNSLGNSSEALAVVKTDPAFGGVLCCASD